MSRPANFAKSIFILLLFFCLILFFAVLKLASAFFIPLTVAVLLALVFLPLCQKLNRLHIPWMLCIVLVLAITLIVFCFFGSLLVSSLSTIVSAYPKYESRFTSIYKIFAETFKLPFDEDLTLISNLLNSLKIREIIQNAAISMSTSLMSFSKIVLVILLFVIFLLTEFKTLKNKVNNAFVIDDMNQKIFKIGSDIKDNVTGFLSIKFIVSLLTGVLVFCGTVVVKMEFPIVWGILAFILNFIPNFGSIISFLLTTLFAVLQFYPEWGKIIYVALLLLIVNMVLGNFVEPHWEGDNLKLSPFVILVSLSFWGWMWGFVGMILAVPLMVILKIVCIIICKNIGLQSVASLLGDSEED